MLKETNNRTIEWLESQEFNVQSSLEKVIFSWNLGKELEEMSMIEKKKTGFLVDTALSAYGLNIDEETYQEIVDGFYPELKDELKQGLTDNHSSLATKIKGGGVQTTLKYAPVLMGEYELGALAPLKVKKKEQETVVQINNSVIDWELGIDFPNPPTHAVTYFEHNGETFLGKSYVDACVSSDKGGFVLVDSNHSCEQGCAFCTYEGGDIELMPDNFAKLKKVLTCLVENTGSISACFSSGSGLAPDRKMVDIFAPMLKIVDELKQEYSEVDVALELELMPWDESVDPEVLDLIDKYYQKGYIKAVNLNIETPVGIDREEFMQTGLFGKAEIPVMDEEGKQRSYLGTFKLLREKFPEIQLAGLIVYGVKPQFCSWADYSRKCLETVDLFAQHNVKILLQPAKISSKTKMAEYPVVDLFWLTGSILLADFIHLKHQLEKKQRVGCVNGCDACDSSRSGYSLLKFIQRNGGDEQVEKLLSPWLDEL